MDIIDQLADSDGLGEIKFYGQALGQVLNKVVIQEIQSRLYLSEGDFWTPDIEIARTFDSRGAALQETTHLKLQNVQLVPNR
jgi:hypothetical protein